MLKLKSWVLLAAGAALGHAGPIAPAYRVLICGIDVACPAHIRSWGGAKAEQIEEQLAVLPDALFRFYESQEITYEGDPFLPFFGHFRDANARGTMIGGVGHQGGNFHSQFIYLPHRGVFCCTLDWPFVLNDINDLDVVVGATMYQAPHGSFLDPFVGEGELYYPFIVVAEHRHTLGYVAPPLFHHVLGAVVEGELTEISNDGLMLGKDFRFFGNPGTYNVMLVPIPEPSSGIMVLGALLFFARTALMRRSRNVPAEPARAI
jgi:hypothetical protein